MSLSIASIPGAKECLDKIAVIARERDLDLANFFVTVRGKGKGPRAGPPIYLCNFVFQGGGVLGLAHVGFLAGLEHAGVRCAGVAGTSAGAIVATGLACARRTDLYQPVASKLLQLVATMPMGSFIDGPPSVRRVVKHALNGYPVFSPSYWLGLLDSVRRILRGRGLNPGHAFENWLADALADFGVPDNRVLASDLHAIERELRTRIKVPFGFSNRHHAGAIVVDPNQKPQLLRVVATGLPAGLKLTFPDGLKLLDRKYQQASPAVFVRASMAIPGFFEPRILELDRTEWTKEVWQRLEGLVADKKIHDISGLPALQLVDGGVLSNVQVDAFETMGRPPPLPGRPKRQTTLAGTAGAQLAPTVRSQFPTVVATLVNWHQEERRSRNTIRGLFEDALGLAQAMRLQRDRDAWWRIIADGNQDVRIVEVDTTKFNWLNFTMSEAEMGRLFMAGLERSLEFLKMVR